MAKKPKDLPWAQEFEWAKTICALRGCTVERSTAMYEIAKVKGPGVSLILYPHRTTARSYHVRVRDNGSKDQKAAEAMMLCLDRGIGLPEDEAKRVRFSCTFSRKNNPVHFNTPDPAPITPAQ